MRYLPGVQVHWSEQGKLWASRGYQILTSSENDLKWTKLVTLPVPLIQRALARIAPISRLLRLHIRSYVQLSDDAFIAFCNGKIFFWKGGHGRPQCIGSVRRGGGPLLQGSCQDDRGNCYYGEYWRNPEREEVYVHTWNSASGEWTPYYVFPKQSTRHVHAVQFDPYTRRVWIATGDRDNESRIGYFESRGGRPELEVIASGSQRTRAVSLLFTREFVYWGTDAGGRGDSLQPNHIYRWSRASHEIEQLSEVGGPVYYSSAAADGRLFFATTVESSEPEKDSFARLWKSDDGVQWQEIGRWEKDNYPFLFGYGLLSFARGQSVNATLYVTASGVKGGPGTWAFEARDLARATASGTMDSVAGFPAALGLSSPEIR